MPSLPWPQSMVIKWRIIVYDIRYYAMYLLTMNDVNAVIISCHHHIDYGMSVTEI